MELEICTSCISDECGEGLLNSEGKFSVQTAGDTDKERRRRGSIGKVVKMIPGV